MSCFRATYPQESVTREDIFHYIYGLLHSEYYRKRFELRNVYKGVAGHCVCF